jgi:hypothetical protein
MVLTVKGLITGKVVGLEHGWDGEAYQRRRLEKGQSNDIADHRPDSGQDNTAPSGPQSTQ